MSRNPHIVVIDDNPDDRALTVHQLQKEYPDLEATEVALPAEFAQALESASFDLVVTDYQLHWTNGLRILHEVKARLPCCPVIMLTGAGSEEIAVEAMKAGLDDYVLKSSKYRVRLPAAARSALENAERRRAAEELKGCYRHLVETSPDAIAVYSDGKIVFVNDAALELLGATSPAQVIGRSALDFIHPDDLERVTERVRTIADERRPMPLEEEKFMRLDGTHVDVEVAANPIIYGGKPSVQVVVRDITERKQIDQLKSDFVAMVSHELRTPLAVILGYADVIDRSSHLAGTSEILEGAAKKIRERGGLMRHLVEDLLEVSRIQASALTTAAEWTDIAELAKSSAESVPLTENHVLRFSVAPNLPRVHCDSTQISIALTNLVSNAVKFSPRGGRIDVAVWREEDCVRMSVEDEGVGIAPEDQSRIFGRFVQADISRTHTFGGAGLGLYITSKIVEAHGGRIQIESEPGKGSTFTIEIPIGQEEMAA